MTAVEWVLFGVLVWLALSVLFAVAWATFRAPARREQDQ